MTVPLVWSLARRYPHLRITVLSSPFARVLFDSMAPNVGFMEADLKNEYRGVKGLNALYRRLTKITPPRPRFTAYPAPSMSRRNASKSAGFFASASRMARRSLCCADGGRSPIHWP